MLASCPSSTTFYPETAGRSLEEIDLIFAKGYVEKISYVRAAKELPKMNEEEVAAAVRELDARLSDEETPSSGNSMKEGAEVKENHLPELNLKGLTCSTLRVIESRCVELGCSYKSGL